MKPLVLISALFLAGCSTPIHQTYQYNYDKCMALSKTMTPDRNPVYYRAECEHYGHVQAAGAQDCAGCNLPVVVIPRY